MNIQFELALAAFDRDVLAVTSTPDATVIGAFATRDILPTSDYAT